MWATLTAALRELEELGPDASGTLSFGTPAVGAIFVDLGEICWIAAAGLQDRLRALLADLPPEEALRRHSCESLIALCLEELPRTWTPRAGGYGPATRFTPFALWLDVAAALAPEDPAPAGETLAELDVELQVAVFAPDPERDALWPVAACGDALTIASVCRLARTARPLADAAAALGAAPSFTLATTESGATVAAWWEAGHLFLVPCDDRSHAAIVAARQLRA